MRQPGLGAGPIGDTATRKTCLRKLLINPSLRFLAARRWRLVLSVLALTWLFPGSARAQNALRWTTNYYAVTGATLVAIRQSLRQSRPWKARSTLDGLTEWRIDWRFNVTPSDRGCRCSSFTTQTTITTTLPLWRAPTNVADGVKAAWDRYAAALGQHEASHAGYALLAVAELHKRVKRIEQDQDCIIMKKRINDAGQEVVAEYRRLDRDYDQRTRHGATEGAVLPARIGRER